MFHAPTVEVTCRRFWCSSGYRVVVLSMGGNHTRPRIPGGKNHWGHLGYWRPRASQVGSLQLPTEMAFSILMSLHPTAQKTAKERDCLFPSGSSKTPELESLIWFELGAHP